MKPHYPALALTFGLAAASHAAVILPSLVSEEYVFRSAAETLNNSLMTPAVTGGDTLASALLATHGWDGAYQQSYVSTAPGGTADFFASIGGDTDVDLVFDLTGGGDTTIGSAILWQYQNWGSGGSTSSALQAGNNARTVEIRVNTEAQGTASFIGAATTVTLLPVADGDADPLNDLGGTNSAQFFGLGGGATNARYVQVSITDNYRGLNGMTGGGDRVGLGEVRFASEIPEPSTLALLGLGGLALIRRRR